jgi:exodeoxyribonuclease VII large subunit
MAQERHRHTARLGTLAARLETLSPLAVLGRGYAVCWDADGRTIVRDAAAVRPGEAIRVVLARGELQADVTRTTPEGGAGVTSPREPS